MFPFGQPLRRVLQTDRTPKKIFILGVYASAVHARWLDKNGKQLVSALAVASEPEIFWNGKGAEEIIRKINFKEAGTLTVPADNKLNGPSGRTLDEHFLVPLKCERKDVWLCDLLAESRVNSSQRKAIKKHYMPLVEKLGLPRPSVPDFDKSELERNSEYRQKEILAEIRESGAETLVLLGDLPIRYFLKGVTKNCPNRLAAFVEAVGPYGRKHEMHVGNIQMNVIPLCHPRQAGRLGKSNEKWAKLHEDWENRV